MKTQFGVLCAVALIALAGERSVYSQGGAGPLAFGNFSVVGQSGAPATPALTLDEIERIALAENPEIHVAVRRVAMAEAHVPTTGRRDDPQFMLRNWQVPLSKPWDLNAAQNMLMLSQSLPGPGKRDLQSSVAQADVAVVKEQLEQARLRVRVEARKAFFDLLLAQEEMRIHDQHVGIARQAVEAARIKYTVGKVPQQDVLKAQLAVTRLEEHMIRFERDAEVARVRMNTLLGRDAETPVRVQGDFGINLDLPAKSELEQVAFRSRPDLLEAQAVAEKSRKEQALAGKAYVPDFSVAGGYMLMPTGSDPRNNYMFEGSVTLPWLNRRKHDAEINEAAVKVTEQDAEVAAMRNAAAGQVGEALAGARSAQRLARMYHDSLEPQAESTLHAAVIAYENNQTDLLDLIDSQMAVIDVNLAWLQSMGEFAASMSELELAVGAPVEQKATPEEKQ
ncbi:TolC family protein [Occallatibacter riparius]|uniref:TolC family protein n=1 Tax=Occallatibacter riparius TaxID=1002689 RepID=A0A9J7BT75_9BACT|nr:TolC family protein [Occallatibacter riparius]UWZ84213.1 TolC family protein [Occallatibacter riparius]